MRFINRYEVLIYPADRTCLLLKVKPQWCYGDEVAGVGNFVFFLDLFMKAELMEGK